MKELLKTLILILLPTIIFGQAKYEGLNVIETENSYIIEFSLPEISYKKIQEPFTNETFYQLQINNDFGIIDEIGKPELPQITFDFEIPLNENVPQFEIITTKQTEKNITYKVYPFQKPISTEKPYKVTKFDFDESYYQSSGENYDIISISTPYITAGKKGVKVTIIPINYSPLANKLQITDYLKFEIKTKPVKQSEKPLTVTHDNFFSNHFVNYQQNENKSIEYGNYLIITAPQYETTINYFAVYKENLGYNVTVVNTNSTGTTSDNIKNYIQTQYDNSSTRPVFVLLVGDTDEIPSWTGDGPDNPQTDLKYAQLEGNDRFADVYLGRFSVRTMSPTNTDIIQLQNIINKTIFMESNIQSFNKKAVFMAGAEQHNQTEGGHDYAVEETFEPEGYTCLKLYADDGATSSDAIDALNDNQIFSIYSGHGSTSSLYNPNVSQSNVRSLTNTFFPFAYSFAFNSVIYQENECFGETWIRDDHGGVIYYGASHTTWYNSDKILEKKVFGDAFTDEPQVSPMFNLGMHRYWNHWWVSLSQRRKKYIEQYNLMGDPSLITTGINNSCFANYIFDTDIIFQSGADVTIQADDKIIAGENNSDFIVENGADVTLTAGESIVLKPGFHAEAGSNFHAYIAPCENKNKSITKLSNVKSDISKTEKNTSDYIHQNFAKIFPNPFQQDFTIEYTINTAEPVEIEIFNIYGSCIHKHIENYKTAGTYQYSYNTSNNKTGLYIIKIKSGSFIQSLITLKIQ